MKNKFLNAAASLLLFTIPYTVNAASSLFQDITESAAVLYHSSATDNAVIQSTVFSLNKNVLSTTTTAINIQLEENLSLEFKLDASNLNSSGGLLWQGVLDMPVTASGYASSDYASSDYASSDSSAVLVQRGDNVTGSIRYNGQLYRIFPLGDGQHKVEKVDEELIPAAHAPNYSEPEAGVFPAQTEALVMPLVMPLADPVIKLLVVYTAQVKAEVTDVDSLIDLAIAETNQGYKNSGIKGRVELAYAYQTDYPGTPSIIYDLEQLTTPKDGAMDELQGLRNQYEADVVIMLGADYGYYCGVANNIFADHWSKAFAVVNHNCATGYYTFGHEIGHLQGARHNMEIDQNTLPFAYGHGYHAPDNAWHSIMAYNCPGGCPRLNYWSNPDVSYQSVPMGIAETSDNARVLNKTFAQLASYGGDTSPLPSVELFEGEAVTSISGVSTQEHHFKFDVPPGAEFVKFETANDISGSSTQLFVRHGNSPNVNEYDCGPDPKRYPNHTCVISPVQGGTYYVMVRGYYIYQSYSDISLKVTLPEGSVTRHKALNQWIHGGETRSYGPVNIPVATTKLVVRTTNGTGNLDLYIKYGDTSRENVECKSESIGNDEVCIINKPSAGEWHIVLSAKDTVEQLDLDWSFY